VFVFGSIITVGRKEGSQCEKKRKGKENKNKLKIND